MKMPRKMRDRRVMKAQRRERSEEAVDPLLVVAQRIPQAAMRLDRIERVVDRAQLGAQLLDVRIDGAIETGRRIVPDQVHQLVARIDAPGSLGENLQQPVLIARQIE